MLKHAFPQAEVVGLDLSPYMLVMAEHKAKQAGKEIEWIHAKAEATGFPDDRFDLVTISLLFHETPDTIAKAILRECFRILMSGGMAIVLDGNQKILRQTEWLTNIFEEPYIDGYATGSVDAWMGAAGFAEVQTDDIWLVHQVTRGIKPLLVDNADSLNATQSESENFDSEEILTPAF
jgi:ubiquinone/menaquinone biosynthesis C-methylase UbiE